MFVKVNVKESFDCDSLTVARYFCGLWYSVVNRYTMADRVLVCWLAFAIPKPVERQTRIMAQNIATSSVLLTNKGGSSYSCPWQLQKGYSRRDDNCRLPRVLALEEGISGFRKMREFESSADQFRHCWHGNPAVKRPRMHLRLSDQPVSADPDVERSASFPFAAMTRQHQLAQASSPRKRPPGKHAGGWRKMSGE